MIGYQVNVLNVVTAIASISNDVIVARNVVVEDVLANIKKG
tara:strand:+ start:295 stop:417 length:123 start_codon:yes stop_codon:yes gene_type:complete